ncbi:MAG: TssQ family T6SS-associated lipoprotein [Casimicrobium sp.]|jgi:hypothetical protein
MKRTLRTTLALVIPTLLAACATTPPPPPVNYPAPPPPVAVAPRPPAPVVPAPTPPPPPAVDVSANETALSTAIEAYDRGDYALATRLLTPLSNDATLSVEQHLRALKTLAFSQCSTNAITACRGTFERAFRVDPTFDLSPAERGHPYWGPQFIRARKAVTGK